MTINRREFARKNKCSRQDKSNFFYRSFPAFVNITFLPFQLLLPWFWRYDSRLEPACFCLESLKLRHLGEPVNHLHYVWRPRPWPPRPLLRRPQPHIRPPTSFLLKQTLHFLGSTFSIPLRSKNVANRHVLLCQEKGTIFQFVGINC